MSKDIAIIGMGGRFPSAAGVGELYEHLVAGRDCVRELSERRLRGTGFGLDVACRPLGFLEDIDCFDHVFFNISRREARNLAPQARMLLEVVYGAIEDAGYDVDELRGTDTAVFVSSTGLDYIQLAQEGDPTLKLGNINATIAGRIARYFDLRGSAMMIDTACSSSLVAVHYACRELQSGDASYALACGVKLHIFPPLMDAGDELGIQSKDGRTRSYSSDASGTGSGEAVGCVLLKPLERAMSDGDIIHAVIRGSAVNQDAGLSSTLTSPDSRAQSAVIRRAWEQAGIDPVEIGYVEGHGTGTALGDPIEVRGLDLSFKAYTEARGFCALSSIKSNIGHTDSAAGICGLIKAVLSVKYGQLFAAVHFREPNPLIDFAHAAVYVNGQTRPWQVEAGKKRIAGVSSFGISGTNCHVVLEEAPLPVAGGSAAGDAQGGKEGWLFVFSGRSAESLVATIGAVRRYLSGRQEVSLRDVSYTLRAGRKQYEHRYACTAASRAELLAKLAGAEQGAGGEPRQADKIVLVLSRGRGPSAVELEASGAEAACFGAAYRSCMEIGIGEGKRALLEAFAYQYACYRYITEQGISFKYMMGDELGKLLLGVVKGELELSAGIARAGQLELEEAGLEERVGKLVEKEQGGEAVLYVSLLAESRLMEVLSGAGPGERRTLCAGGEWKGPLSLTGELYGQGVPVDFRGQGGGRRTGLPGYQFKKTRCWLRPESSELQTGPEEWLHRLAWVEAPLRAGSQPRSVERGAVWLVIGSGDGQYRKLLAELSARVECVGVVRTGSGELERDAGLAALLGSAQSGACRLEQVVYLARPQEGDLSGIRELHWLYVRLRGITTGWAVVSACGAELWSAGPYAGLEQGLLRGIQTEDARLRIKHIFVEGDAGESWSGPVAAELLCGERLSYVAYRYGKRYVEELQGLRGVEAGSCFKPGDTYLVTGGASGITHALCRSVIEEVKECCFIICGRRRVSWDNEGQRVSAVGEAGGGDRAEALEELRSLGARVEYYAVDLGEEAAVERLSGELRGRHARIDGVWHGAGVRCGLEPFENKGLEEMQAVWSPKIGGCVNLELVMRGYAPRFVVLFSSTGALVPHKHTTDYAIANTFLDGYARYMSKRGRPFVSVNWPGWKGRPGQQEGEEDRSRISEREGALLLRQALSSGESNVIVGRLDRSAFKINPFFTWAEPVEQAGEAAENGSPGSEGLPAAGQQQGPLAPERREAGGTGPAVADSRTRLRAMWYEVLEAGEIGDEDDFFDLGGHSLNGNQLLSRIEKEFGVRLEFEELFDYCTIGKLAAHLDAAGGVQPAGSVYREILPLGPQPFYELSHAQRRLWVIHQFENSRTAYNMPGAFMVEGAFDAEVFIRSYKAVIDRHESLRTTFVLQDGGPVQRIGAVGSEELYAIGRYDLRGEAEQEALLEELYSRELHHVFDLERGPLIRMGIARLSGDRHLFLFNIHHIVCDGWSTTILLREILHYYSQYLQGREGVLPPLSIHYKDYAAWQNEELRGEAVAGHREYWRQLFSQGVPVLTLPADRPRPVMQTYNGDRVHFRLDGDRTAAIRELVRRQEGTVFMFLVTVIGLLLHKYSGQTAIVVGITSGGREHLKLEDQVGLYLNMLALYIEVPERARVSELFGRVRSGVLSAFEHQVYPLDRLVEELEVPRDLSRHPLFDVMVISQNSHVGGAGELSSPEGLTITGWGMGKQSSKVDLTFTVNEGGEEIYIGLEYNTDIYNRERIERMAGHFGGIVEAMLGSFEAGIGQLEYLPAGERRQLLEDFQGAVVKWGEEGMVMERLSAQAGRSPEAEAVRMGDRRLTYRELEERSNQVAHYLRGLGVREETVVPVCIERSLEMIIGILGIWKAGGAYAPIDPLYPADRIGYMLADMGPSVVVSSRYGRGRLAAGTGLRVVELDGEEEAIGRERRDGWPRSGRVPAGRLAYVIYTSGSTGRPKGVLVEHGGTINQMEAKLRELEMDKEAVVAFTAAYTFDISVWQMFTALLAGGRTVIYPQALLESPEGLAERLNEDGVTLLELVPSYVPLFLQQPVVAGSLRYLMVVGEAIGRHVLEQWFGHRQYGRVPVVNSYGPTEASDTISTYLMKELPPEASVPLGYPLQNLRMYVLSASGALCPVGVRGEICVAGIGVARGYLNRPEQTADRFVRDPFGPSPGDRMYRTGDAGSWLPDGRLEYGGRMDTQVKINGYRVEPEEIENVLRQSGRVQEAVVVAVRGQQEGGRLVGYVVPQGAWQPEQLYGYLREKLPAYMVPAQLISLDALPLTAHGKIDRKTLTERASLAAHQVSGISAMNGMAYEAPRNEIEEKLQTIWMDIMNVQCIGIHDNFFQLGGHSLLVIKLVSAIKKELKIDIPVSALFQHPDIATLAQAITIYRNNMANAMEDYDEIEL